MSKDQSSIKIANGRRYPERPVLGVGALILEGDRILLVERGGEPLRGYWSLPGGGLETGETIIEGVQREVLEETGLIVTPVKLVEVFERIMKDKEGRTEYHYVLIDYLCSVIGGELLASGDAARVAWVPERQLSGIGLTSGTLAVIEKAFRMHREAGSG